MIYANLNNKILVDIKNAILKDRIYFFNNFNQQPGLQGAGSQGAGLQGAGLQTVSG